MGDFKHGTVSGDTRALTRRSFVGGLLSLSALAALGLSGCSGAASSAESVKSIVFCHEGKPDPYAAGAFLGARDQSLSDEGLAFSFILPDEGERALDVVNSGKADLGISSQELLASAFAVDEPASIAAVAAVVQHDTTRQVPAAVSSSKGVAARDSYAVCLIANDAFLVNRQDDAVTAISALAAGYEELASHPDRGAAALAKGAQTLGYPVAEKEATRQIEAISSALLDDSGTWGRISQKRWDAFFSWLHAEGRIDRAIPAHHGYILDYLDGSVSRSTKKESK